jgi:hypothetical protein
VGLPPAVDHELTIHRPAVHRAHARRGRIAPGARAS